MTFRAQRNYLQSAPHAPLRHLRGGCPRPVGGSACRGVCGWRAPFVGRGRHASSALVSAGCRGRPRRWSRRRSTGRRPTCGRRVCRHRVNRRLCLVRRPGARLRGAAAARAFSPASTRRCSHGRSRGGDRSRRAAGNDRALSRLRDSAAGHLHRCADRGLRAVSCLSSKVARTARRGRAACAHRSAHRCCQPARVR